MEKSQTIGLSPSSRAGFLAVLSFFAILGNAPGCCSSKTFKVQVQPQPELERNAIALSVLFAPKGEADKYRKYRDTKASDWFKDQGERAKLLRDLNYPENYPEEKKLVFRTQARPGQPESHKCGPFPKAIEEILIWAALPGNKESTPQRIDDPEKREGSWFWPIWPFCSREGHLQIDVWPDKIKCWKGREEA